MSHLAIEETIRKCPVETAFQDPDLSIGSLAFVDALLKKQWEVSDEELGDYLVDGEQARIEAQALTGIDLDPQTAYMLERAVIGCLTARYLGNCATATGRTLLDKRLHSMNISRYKVEQEA